MKNRAYVINSTLLEVREVLGLMAKKTDRGARAAAQRVLKRVVGGGAFSNIVLDQELKGLEPAERPLATELTYGVLRWLIRLDWIISKSSKIRPEKIEHNVLNALRIGAYQLAFLSGIPGPVAINESVELVKSGGKKKTGFVNAVLRNISTGLGTVEYPDRENDPVKYLSVYYSHPEWMVKRWVERFGPEETEELLKANQEEPPRTLRVNTLVTTREKLMEELSKGGLKVAETEYSPDGITVLEGKPSPTDNRYYIQDEASQLVVRLLDPEPGKTALDACAAPGGKTVHIAALMENKGKITGVDKFPGRIESLKAAAERFGAKIVETMLADAEAKLEPAPRGGFDYILLDSPCSGHGVLRRSPDIKLRRTPKDLEDLASRQKKLLNNVSRYLKKGGHIVYSVCTFEPEETDRIIDGFLSTHRSFELEDPASHLPEKCSAMVDERKRMRMYPHRHGLDGFFAVRMKKQ